MDHNPILVLCNFLLNLFQLWLLGASSDWCLCSLDKPLSTFSALLYFSLYITFQEYIYMHFPCTGIVINLFSKLSFVGEWCLEIEILELGVLIATY